MGSKNRDRWRAEDWRATAETVGKMIDQGWSVMSRCTTCELLLHVDLRLVTRIKGAEFSLWNIRTRCKRVGCEGVVKFVARPPGLGAATQITLDAEWVGGDRKYGPGQR